MDHSSWPRGRRAGRYAIAAVARDARSLSGKGRGPLAAPPRARQNIHLLSRDLQTFPGRRPGFRRRVAAPQHGGSTTMPPEPFRFMDCALIILALGRTAHGLRELRDRAAEVPPQSIWHHFYETLLRPTFDDP